MAFKRERIGATERKEFVKKPHFGFYTIEEAEIKAFDSGAEKLNLRVKNNETGETAFIDMFYQGKKGPVEFIWNLLNDMLDVLKVTDEQLEEFGLETVLNDGVVGLLLNTEEDEWDGKVTVRYKIASVLDPKTLKNPFGKKDDYWFKQLKVEYPTTPMQSETPIIDKAKDLFGDDDNQDEFPF